MCSKRKHLWALCWLLRFLPFLYSGLDTYITAKSAEYAGFYSYIYFQSVQSHKV